MLTIFAASAAYGASTSSLLHRQPLPVVTRHTSQAVRMAEDAATLSCNVRKIEKSAIALDISVPKNVADEIHLKTLAKLAKSAKVPGFRDGKVPPQALIAKLGMQKVKEATVEQIVDVGLTHSGVGQKIQTVGDARLPEQPHRARGRHEGLVRQLLPPHQHKIGPLRKKPIDLQQPDGLVGEHVVQAHVDAIVV